MFHLENRCSYHHDMWNTSLIYQCGSCEKVFPAICQLHSHLLEHTGGGSYHYDHQTRVASPRYDTVCVYVQTESIDIETNSLRTTDNINISESESEMLHSKFQAENGVNLNNFENYENKTYIRDSCDEAKHTSSYNDLTRSNFDCNDWNNIQHGSESNINGKEKINPDRSDDRNLDIDTSQGLYQNGERIKADVSKKSDTQIFQCNHEDCHMQFSTKNDQRLHVAEHSGKTLLSCHICNKKFVHKPALQVHIRFHERENLRGNHDDNSLVHNESEQSGKVETCNGFTLDRKYTCKICKEELPSNSALLLHKKLHKNKKIKFLCTKCPKAYSTKQGLVYHSNIHDGTKFICDICGKVYGQANTLKKHKVQHSLDTQYKCETCGRYFAILSLYKKHMACHTREKQFTCEVCGFQTHCKNSLKAHSLIHGEKQFHCTNCTKVFSRKAALLEHMHTHTGVKPYVCEFCAMAFAYQSALVTHRRIHTGQRPYMCDICLRTFSLRHIYKRHLLTHTEERPYKCSLCDKPFTQEYNLSVHMRRHTGEKPFACEICYRAFTQKCSLKNHMKCHYVN